MSRLCECVAWMRTDEYELSIILSIYPITFFCMVTISLCGDPHSVSILT